MHPSISDPCYEPSIRNSVRAAKEGDIPNILVMTSNPQSPSRTLRKMATPSEAYNVSKPQASPETVHIAGVMIPPTKCDVLERGNSSQIGANSTEPPACATSAHGTAVRGTGVVQSSFAQRANTPIKSINDAPSQTQGRPFFSKPIRMKALAVAYISPRLSDRSR
jgi:hypothetical protein